MPKRDKAKAAKNPKPKTGLSVLFFLKTFQKPKAKINMLYNIIPNSFRGKVLPSIRINKHFGFCIACYKFNICYDFYSIN